MHRKKKIKENVPEEAKTLDLKRQRPFKIRCF